MGYFSNGSEGDYYQSEYCDHCVHDTRNDESIDCCPVWEMHEMLNDEKEIRIRIVLNNFIPRDKQGNKQCVMFIKKGEEHNDEIQ